MNLSQSFSVFSRRSVKLPLYCSRDAYVATVGRVARERNLLALPTLEMYLPLSKFESIH